MWKQRVLKFMIIGGMSLGLVAYTMTEGTTSDKASRIEIKLESHEKEIVMKEMRLMLEGIQNIIGAAAEDDMKKAQHAARHNGLKHAQDANKLVAPKLPMGFKKMGMQLHKSFDKLADDAPSLTSKALLKRTQNIMNSCIACHATYQIVTK